MKFTENCQLVNSKFRAYFVSPFMNNIVLYFFDCTAIIYHRWRSFISCIACMFIFIVFVCAVFSVDVAAVDAGSDIIIMMKITFFGLD